MTTEEMERAIEFLLDHHAKVSTDIERHSEQIGKLTEIVSVLSGDVQMLAQAVEANRLDTREAIDNLIISNEVTRKLSEDVAQLATGISQRVTGIDRRLADLEAK